MNLDFFPPLNASLNGAAFVCLTVGYYFIKVRKDQKAHRMSMFGAMIISAVFLACYLTYHFLKDGVHTRFPETGFIGVVYYTMLISHVLLAMVNLPLILITFGLAIKGRFEAHRAWAKWTFPIWYYVSITGVLVYFFLYQWFPGERV